MFVPNAADTQIEPYSIDGVEPYPLYICWTIWFALSASLWVALYSLVRVFAF